MSKARDIADLGAVTSRLDTVGASDGALSNRNLIINGAMQVAQRGVGPVSIVFYNYNTADRMRFSSSSGTSGTWTQQEVVSDQDVGDFIGNALKSTCSVAGSGGNEAGLNIRLELQDVEKYVGQQMTLSYYAKSDAALTLTPKIFADATITMGTDTFTTSYTRYTHTFTLTSMSSKSYLDLTMRVDGEVATTHYITGVQLELGDTATPFEHRSYGDELARCQRYFEILYNTNANSTPASYSSVGGGHFYCTPMTYAVTKRTTPTATINGGSAYWTIPGIQGYGAYGTKTWGTIGLDTTAVTPYANHVSGNGTPANANVYRWEATLEVILDAEL